MKKAFVTFLGTENFLPGLFSLSHSLKKFGNTTFPLVVMISDIIPKKIVEQLKRLEFNIRVVKEIKSPFPLQNDYRNFNATFTKLRIFELYEFEKLVYLDSDLIVCENIQDLFNKEHMSAVIAGGILPRNTSWKDLNSGLMVVEPSPDIFDKMLDALKLFPSSDGSDQGFLHSFFPNWKNETKLHLHHRYNVPVWFLDEYCSKFDFNFTYKKGFLSTNNISVLHFWGLPKPWQINTDSIDILSKQGQAQLFWKSIADEIGPLKGRDRLNGTSHFL